MQINDLNGLANVLSVCDDVRLYTRTGPDDVVVLGGPDDLKRVKRLMADSGFAVNRDGTLGDKPRFTFVTGVHGLMDGTVLTDILSGFTVTVSSKTTEPLWGRVNMGSEVALSPLVVTKADAIKALGAKPGDFLVLRGRLSAAEWLDGKAKWYVKDNSEPFVIDANNKNPHAELAKLYRAKPGETIACRLVTEAVARHYTVPAAPEKTYHCRYWMAGRTDESATFTAAPGDDLYTKALAALKANPKAKPAYDHPLRVGVWTGDGKEGGTCGYPQFLEGPAGTVTAQYRVNWDGLGTTERRFTASKTDRADVIAKATEAMKGKGLYDRGAFNVSAMEPGCCFGQHWERI